MSGDETLLVRKLYPAKEDMSSQTTPKAGSVAPALEVLKFLAVCDQPLGVNAIARELSLPVSTSFRILKQLQASDFAEFDKRTKCYSLGPAAIDLARRALDPANSFSVLRSRLEKVAQDHGVAVGFWRVTSRSRIVLAGFVEGGNPMRIHMSVGQRLPMFVGGVGRAIAAKLDLDEAALRAQFETLRWQSPPSFETYAREVAEARENGYAVDRDNFALGVTTTAVAIGDGSGLIGYGLSGIMFSRQASNTLVKALGESLIEVADWGSRRLIASHAA